MLFLLKFFFSIIKGKLEFDDEQYNEFEEEIQDEFYVDTDDPVNLWYPKH